MCLNPFSSSSASASASAPSRLFTLRSAAATFTVLSSSSPQSSHFNSSSLASQPVDHLSAINRFLEPEAIIHLFRCTRRLYDLTPHYRVTLKTITFGCDERGRIILVKSGRQLANFRFCLFRLSVNENFGQTQSWKAVQDAIKLNPRMFSSLKHISFSFGFRSRSKFNPSCLPPGLESLTIYYGPPPLLSAIVQSLPRFSNLKSLSFACVSKLDSIPPIVCPSLESLILSCDLLDSRRQNPFSASVFPVSLRTLDLSRLNCDDPLPPFSTLTGLEKLMLPERFNDSITPDLFPASLKSLTFGRSFKQPIQPGSLPLELEYLSLSFRGGPFSFDHPLLPGSLPPKLRVLHLSDRFNHPLTPGVLPDNLIELHFPSYCEFDQPFLTRSLPSSLLELSFGEYSKFDQPLLPGILPPGLEMLELKSQFDQPLLAGCLPASLKSLSLGPSFNQPIQLGSLPPGLESLEFYVLGDSLFNQPLLPGSLPTTLKTIQFGWAFNQPLPPGVLPSSLTELCFDSYSCFNQPLQFPFIRLVRSSS